MLLRRLWAFFWGYVTISVEGPLLERFLNLALARNIYFWDVTREGDRCITLKVTAKGFKPLRHVARRTASKVRIKRKHGTPFLWMRIKKRKMLALGVVVFLLGIYLFSSFIWTVEIASKEELQYTSMAEITKELASLGVKRGAYKGSIDMRYVENQLEARIPKLAWVGMTIQGTRVYIEVVEKTLPPDTKAEKTPAHVVAKKDGLVEEVLVIAGEARVEAGDAVSNGQVLISGVIYPQQQEQSEDQPQDASEAKPRYVHAKGVVKARVWYTVQGVASLVVRGERKTGRKATRVSIKTGDKEIIIKGPRKSPFKFYQNQQQVKTMPRWRNFDLPVELSITTYHEVEKYQLRRDKEDALALALDQAERRLTRYIPSHIKVLDKKKQATISDGKVATTVTWEVMEDIAVTKLLQ